MLPTIKTPICRGVAEISKYTGINPKRFTYFRVEAALPVFKTDIKSKTWLARCDDLDRWIEKRKQEFLRS